MRKLFALLMVLVLTFGVLLPVGAAMEPGQQMTGPVGLSKLYQGDLDNLQAQKVLSPIVFAANNSTGNTAILKSVTLRSGSGSSSTNLGSTGSINGNSSSAITISNSYSANTNAYVSWELADGARLQSATWDGSSISNNTQKNLPGSNGSSTLILKITATDNQVYTATITIKRATESTHSLSSLYIKDRVTSSTSSDYLYELDRTFSSSTTSYSIDVPSDEEIIYIYYSTNSNDASVSLSGGSKRTSRSGYYEVELDNGTNTLSLKVTHDGSSTTYNITVDREDSVERNASLSELAVRAGSSTNSTRYTMDPTFTYNRTNYDVNLETSVKEVYLHFTSDRNNASISVSGTGTSKVSDGVYKVSLVAGRTNTANIKVTYSGESTTYTIRLNSGGNLKTTLSGLVVSSRENTNSSYQYNLFPSFESSTFNYVAFIPYDRDLSRVYIRPTLKDTDHDLKVNNKNYSSGDWVSIDLKPGDETTVTIKVVDGSNTSTYTLDLIAADRNAGNDTTLSSLSLRPSSNSGSSLDLTPAFDKNTTSYTAAVEKSQESIRVYATASDSQAKILVNDVLMSDSYRDVSLAEGRNTIKVVVYAADGETNKTYTLTVTRDDDSISSTALSNLELRIPSGQTISLIPSFNSNTMNYRVTVPGDNSQISLRPTAANNNATITVKGQPIASGQWTEYYNLNRGDNSFIVMVTSNNNAVSYVVTVECGLTVQVSDQSMQVNGQLVQSAAFNINGNNYFKLRDIAYALRGTNKHFEVTYDNLTRVIKMTSGFDYTIIGGEMVQPAVAQQTVLSDQKAMKDGAAVNSQAYNIDGNNYFMLRDIGRLFNFGVGYDEATRTMVINTSLAYTP